MIAALFVSRNGPYWERPGIDAWDQERDARSYRGPWSVIAHPPCKRWCKLAHEVAARYPSMPIGVDGGCFASALQSVRTWGGVLEHPAYTLAWPEYHLVRPQSGSWQQISSVEWVTQVSQVAYGHRARKRTWLYYVSTHCPPGLDWTEPMWSHVASGRYAGKGHSMAPRERERTPAAFAKMLTELAQKA
jgi:hypothetical protein